MNKLKEFKQSKVVNYSEKVNLKIFPDGRRIITPRAPMSIFINDDIRYSNIDMMEIDPSDDENIFILQIINTLSNGNSIILSSIALENSYITINDSYYEPDTLDIKIVKYNKELITEDISSIEKLYPKYRYEFTTQTNNSSEVIYKCKIYVTADVFSQEFVIFDFINTNQDELFVKVLYHIKQLKLSNNVSRLLSFNKLYDTFYVYFNNRYYKVLGININYIELLPIVLSKSTLELTNKLLVNYIDFNLVPNVVLLKPTDILILNDKLYGNGFMASDTVDFLSPVFKNFDKTSDSLAYKVSVKMDSLIHAEDSEFIKLLSDSILKDINEIKGTNLFKSLKFEPDDTIYKVYGDKIISISINILKSYKTIIKETLLKLKDNEEPEPLFEDYTT